ncbi:MAG TPA: lysylphosphatidylglycerol synthase domain-containing protein [Gemmataceae bacterium]
MRRVWERVWPLLRVLVPLGIVAAVGWQFARVLTRPELTATPFELRPGWLVPAAGLYLLALLVWASFWADLLRAHGVNVSRGLGLRVYFVSLLGKYIPGKAWVVLMRVGMLRAHAPSRAAVALAAAYETLTTMAAGALVGLLLLPSLGERANIFAGKEGYLLLLVGLPLGVGLVHRLIARRSHRHHPAGSRPHFRLLMLARGLAQASVGWGLIGLSLWATVEAVRPGPTVFTVTDLLRYTTMAALPYVLGFAALVVPGGVGVREWFVQALLAAELSAAMPPAEAEALGVVIALVLRLVWTAGEVAVIAGIYAAGWRWGGRSR